MRFLDAHVSVSGPDVVGVVVVQAQRRRSDPTKPHDGHAFPLHSHDGDWPVQLAWPYPLRAPSMARSSI